MENEQHYLAQINGQKMMFIHMSTVDLFIFMSDRLGKENSLFNHQRLAQKNEHNMLIRVGNDKSFLL